MLKYSPKKLSHYNATLWGITETTYLSKTIPKVIKLKKPTYTYPYIRKDEMLKFKENRYKQSISPKIILAGKRFFEAFYDENGEYVAGKTTYIIKKPKSVVDISMKVLLGILNSSLISFYISEVYATRGIDGGVDFNPDLVEDLPLPKLTDKQKNEIEELVNKIIPLYKKYYETNLKKEEEIYQESLNTMERRIDEIIALSFGLQFKKYENAIIPKRKKKKI